MNENLNNQDSNVIYTIKPKYRLTYEFLKRNFSTFLILLILSIPSANMGFVVTYVAVIIIYFIFLIIYLIYIKIKYKGITYEFYQDKVIYTTKLFRTVVKEILYENVKEIRYNQDVLQKLYKQGDIIITMNSGIFRNVIISEIKDPEIAYLEVHKLIPRTTINDSEN